METRFIDLSVKVNGVTIFVKAYHEGGYQVTPAWEGGYNTFYGKITLSNKKKEEWVKWQW